MDRAWGNVTWDSVVAQVRATLSHFPEEGVLCLTPMLNLTLMLNLTAVSE